MKKKDNNKKKVFLGIFIVVIMVSSILGYTFKEDEEDSGIVFNGVQFYQNQDKWVAYVGNGYFAFDYLPNEVEEIQYETFQINSNKVYLGYIPTEKNVNFDYGLSKVYSTLNSLGIKSVLACSEEENCPDIPLVDCSNEFQVVSFIESEDNKIYKEDNCIILECTSDEISKCADTFNYVLLGVIK
ncbi:MAG: hypothetical protein ABH849_02010 [Nanoarchaeota archaeon]